MADEVQVRQSVIVAVEQLHTNSWNPNEMDDPKFNQLVDKIRDEQFCEPLKVVEIPRDSWEPDWDVQYDKHYRIWAGEHRWRAARVIGMTQVPVYIYTEMTDRDQRLKTVRDNLVHGDLNAVKFTALVHSLDEGMDVDPVLLGFSDRDEMLKYIVQEKSARERSFLDDLLESANRQKTAVDSLSDIVANIFRETAATVDQNYLMFTYKGQTHCVVMCTPSCFGRVKAMTEVLHRTAGDVNDFVEPALAAHLERVQAELPVQSVGPGVEIT